ncbi:hypothetical protein N9L19_00155 [bacterium]|nr:hypothetical protein [bacterium]
MSAKVRQTAAELFTTWLLGEKIPASRNRRQLQYIKQMQVLLEAALPAGPRPSALALAPVSAGHAAIEDLARGEPRRNISNMSPPPPQRNLWC